MFGILSFKDRFEACAYLREIGNVYYTYLLKHNGVPFYVGISKNWKRIHGHFSDNKKRVNVLLRRKIRSVERLGDVVEISIINHYPTKDDMFHAEINLINFYGRKIEKSGPLCNLSEGGEGARYKSSEKQKEAARKANSGRIVSDETRRKLSVALKNTFTSRDGTFKGKKHSDATKQKMSESHSGENHPQYGVRGKDHFNYGKKRPEWVITKIKEAVSKIDNSCTDKRKQQLKDYWNSQPLLTCPHCGKQSSFKPAMLRYHFDRCKHKQ